MNNMSNLIDWSCLEDAKKLFRIHFLDINSPTDRCEDYDDYENVFGDLCISKPFVNIGAGNWRHKYLKNIDHSVPPYHEYGKPDINTDLSLKNNPPFNIVYFYKTRLNESLWVEAVK